MRCFRFLLVSLVALSASACYSPGDMCGALIDDPAFANDKIVGVNCKTDADCHEPADKDAPKDAPAIPQVACYYCKAAKCAVVPGPFRCNLTVDPDIRAVCPAGYTCQPVAGDSNDWCINNAYLTE
jgi:hypothetical protein